MIIKKVLITNTSCMRLVMIYIYDKVHTLADRHHGRYFLCMEIYAILLMPNVNHEHELISPSFIIWWWQHYGKKTTEKLPMKISFLHPDINHYTIRKLLAFKDIWVNGIMMNQQHALWNNSSPVSSWGTLSACVSLTMCSNNESLHI